MLLLFLIGVGSVSPPVPSVAGIVFGSDQTGFKAFGGDEPSAEGMMVGEDNATGVVYGGDG